MILTGKVVALHPAEKRNKMNWIKKNALSIIAIILSVTAVLRADPFTFSESSLSWLLGIAVTVVSVGMVAILGYQIYNASTLEERYRKAFDKRIKEAEEKLSASGVQSATALLYQAEGINLKLAIGTGDYISATKTLTKMTEHAMLLNEGDRISDIARLIVNTQLIIDSKGVKSSSLDDFFLALARTVLARLPASDVQARRLLLIVEKAEAVTGSDDRDTPQG